jgi:two-component system chemotaxis response regulator CheY
MKTHILLIDDDMDELVIFMDALRNVPHEDGFKCTYASSARQAIEMLKYLVPDWVFTDFNLPEINGLELLKFMKETSRFCNTHICLYSTHINQSTAKRVAAMGADFLQKTGTIDALAKNIARLFATKRQPRYHFSNITVN